jgi:uncharacterized membrane protein
MVEAHQDLELFTSKVLRMGVLLSGLIILSGILLLWSTGDTSCPTGVFTVDWLVHGSPFLEPSHVLFVGFLVLISTPLLRVAMTTIFNIQHRDNAFALISGTFVTKRLVYSHENA